MAKVRSNMERRQLPILVTLTRRRDSVSGSRRCWPASRRSSRGASTSSRGVPAFVRYCPLGSATRI